jgi:hypothetical protein
MSTPTRYNPDLALLICERIATTPQSLAKICQAGDMPSIARHFRNSFKISPTFEKSAFSSITKTYRKARRRDQFSGLPCRPFVSVGWSGRTRFSETR